MITTGSLARLRRLYALAAPVIWIDDVEIGQREHKAFAKNEGAHLLIKPDAEYGLLESDLKSIKEMGYPYKYGGTRPFGP